MCKTVGVAVILLLGAVVALPARDELMFDEGTDSAVVESTVREARAAPEHIEDLLQPGVKDAYLHKYGDDEGAEDSVQGYLKKSSDKGNDGYKHFDSYHKKDGDKYGFASHSEYGQGNKGKVGGKGKSSKYSLADKYRSGSDEEVEDGEETKNSYKVVEELNEDDKNRKAVEDYDVGYYGDSGESEKYTDGESEGYTDGESENLEEEGDSESYTGYDDGDSDSGHYTSDDGETGSYTSGAEYDDGESQGYTAEEDEGDY